MEERNKWLEADGLFWESESHEWFHDKSSTNYARIENINGVSLPNLKCFVTRNKETGRYERVVMDSKTNEIVFASDELEAIGGYIDRLKCFKHFNI